MSQNATIDLDEAISVITNVNVPLLRRQKLALLRAINNHDLPKKDWLLLDGILNLLDALHDAIDPPKTH